MSLLGAAVPPAPLRWLSAPPAGTLKQWVKEMGPHPPERQKSLLPLVAWLMREEGLSVPTLLKTALVREELRSRAFRTVLEDTARLLAELGEAWIVCGEAAVMLTAYPDPALRHCGALDLLLPNPASCARVRQAMQEAGWEQQCHPRGLRVRLHTRWPGPFRTSFRWLWRDAPAHAWAPGGRVLAPADQLLETLIRPFAEPTAESFPWEVDAQFLLRDAECLPRLDRRARANGSSALVGAALLGLGRPESEFRWSWRAFQLALGRARPQVGGLSRLLPGLTWSERLGVALAVLLPGPGDTKERLPLRRAVRHLAGLVRQELRRFSHNRGASRR